MAFSMLTGVTGSLSGIDWRPLLEKALESRRSRLAAIQQRLTRWERWNASWDAIASAFRELQSAAEAVERAVRKPPMRVESSDPERVVVSAAPGARLYGGMWSVEVVRLAHAHRVASGSPLPDGPLGLSGYIEFSADGGATWVRVDLAASDTAQDVVRKWNSATEAAQGPTVQASLVSGHLVLSRSREGPVPIMVRDGDTDLLESLGITVPGTQDTAFARELVSPSSAEVKVDGLTVVSETNQLEGAVPGITLSLRALPQGPVTVRVNEDTSAVSSAVERLVSAYNRLLDAFRGAAGLDLPPEQRVTADLPLMGDWRVRSGELSLRMLAPQGVSGLSSADRYGHLAFDPGAWSPSGYDAVASWASRLRELASRWLGPSGLIESAKREGKEGSSREQARLSAEQARLKAEQARLERQLAELDLIVARAQAQMMWFAAEEQSWRRMGR